MNMQYLQRAIIIRSWIKSCINDDQIDSCANFINRYMSDDKEGLYLFSQHITLQRLLVNGMDYEAIQYARQCEGEAIIKNALK